jgi:Trehalase
LDGDQIYAAVNEVGPHRPDGAYSRIGWHHPPGEAPITLEWSRTDATTVVGRLSAASTVVLVLEAYLPRAGSSTEGLFSVSQGDRFILGERYFDHDFSSTLKFLIMTDRPLVSSGTYASLEDLRNGMRASGRLNSSGDPSPGAAGIEFSPDISRTSHFVAVLGTEEAEMRERARHWLAPGTIDPLLSANAEKYATTRPRVDGLFAGAPEAIGNTMLWNNLYAPSAQLAFPSISRVWAHNFGGWVLGEWDCFFGALLSSLEDKSQTLDAIKGLLSTQTDRGVVPNIAAGNGITPDRAEPPVGAYLVWKIYQRFKDRDFLAWAYPRLAKWHNSWLADRGDGQPWRDGNRDGLLEWGSDRGDTATIGARGSIRQAKWESGMDDSPMYDDATYDVHTYTMNLNDVGLNSLYALDAECLANLARELQKDTDARRFADEYERMKNLIRDKLWNERDGIYENRYWNGHFSPRLSPTNFYPLLAGIASPEQARRMVHEHLLNPKEFWGTYVIPTIARNDSAFEDQFYWRGDIWGPTNYMVYQGLDRYGFDDEAFAFAQKSYTLFIDDWKTAGHSDENYHTWGGNGGGDTHYTWGALLCLVALEQYIDQNPWEGLRFGALNPPTDGKFHGALWGNQTYDVAIGPTRTALIGDGKVRFEADRAVVVRHYQPQAFTIRSMGPVHVTIGEFDSGPLRLQIDGKPSGTITVERGHATFALEAGEHTIELVR